MSRPSAVRTTEAETQAGRENARGAKWDGVHLKTILGLALATRLAIVADVLLNLPHGWFFRSQGELGFLAQSLLAGHGLSSPFGGSTGPTAFLAPGYPVLIAAIFHLFGSFTTSSAAAIMLLQTLFCVLTILLLVQIALQEFGPACANLAGFFWAIGLPFLWLPAIFWETSLTILLLTCSLTLALWCVRSDRSTPWALMGLCGGVTMLVNPSFSLVLLAIYCWTVARSRASWRPGPAIAFVIALLLFAPWPVRNARVLHAFIPLRSNLGFELWKGNRPGATSIDDAKLYPVFNRPEYDSYSSKGEVAFMRDKSTAAKQYIRAHPATFARLSAERFVRYWTGTGATDPSILLASFAVLTTLLALPGLWWLVKAGRGDLAVLFSLPLLLFPLPYYVTHCELRFRLVIEPVTTLLSAYAIVHAFHLLLRRVWIRRRSNGR